ncbi:MAG: PilZ domain-containing protein [Candidatus Omnitrophota bacterium]|nr:PilZ domain-containing protein [Candidatus Omnitrophota bacterium]
MTTWEGMDRRKFPRANYPCLLIVRRDHIAPEALLTHTENIGVGGVGIIIKRELNLFAPVELELDLLDMQQHIKCEGKIVWVVRRKENAQVKPLFFDVGIEFSNLSEKDHKRIEFIVNRLIKLESQKPE